VSTAPPTVSRNRRTRTRYIVAASVCGLAIVAIIVLAFTLSKNVVYFRTATEAVKMRSSEGDHRFRLAGQVVPGSIRETGNGVEFEVTDGKATVPVDHTGDPPDLFKGCAPVVVEGHWSKGSAFDSDRILIKHGSEYTPPTVRSQHAGSTCPSAAT
jgi:cytochrome c-type biogenesis protein CcmE